MTQTVAVFGGSFNPPHIGHVLAAAYVLSVHAVDRVLVVPVFQHPFDKELVPFEQRLRMARLAMSPLPAVEVSDVERELSGESRTLYTIEKLLEQGGDRTLRLVIGSDVLTDLPKWHRFERIAELAPPIVLGRVGYPAKDLDLIRYGIHDEVPAAVLPEVSSTEIRSALRQGDAQTTDHGATHLLPTAVREYIADHGLYRS